MIADAVYRLAWLRLISRALACGARKERANAGDIAAKLSRQIFTVRVYRHGGWVNLIAS
jgi:hypothetical protein